MFAAESSRYSESLRYCILLDNFAPLFRSICFRWKSRITFRFYYQFRRRKSSRNRNRIWRIHTVASPSFLISRYVLFDNLENMHGNKNYPRMSHYLPRRWSVSKETFFLFLFFRFPSFLNRYTLMENESIVTSIM